MDMFSWLLKERVLKGGVLSEDWLTLCELALPLNYYDLGEITALVAMPCELGTVVVKDSSVFSTDEKPGEMIQKWLNIHRFVSTELKSHSLGVNSLMTPNFCLAAIPESQETLWVNPLGIYQLYCGNEGVLVELVNGLKLDVSIDCQDFLRCIVETFYAFSHQPFNSFP